MARRFVLFPIGTLPTIRTLTDGVMQNLTHTREVLKLELKLEQLIIMFLTGKTLTVKVSLQRYITDTI